MSVPRRKIICNGLRLSGVMCGWGQVWSVDVPGLGPGGYQIFFFANNTPWYHGVHRTNRQIENNFKL